ncbi:MAG: hypothetical protein AB8B69_20335 [Chitinophagales bacterium]
MYKHLITSLLVFLFLFAGCKTKDNSTKTDAAKTETNIEETTIEVVPDKSYVFPYNFAEPTQKQKMPNELDELSGLDFLGGTLFACIQDEKANVYIYNFETDEVTSDVDFGKNGDFEDVEVVGKEIWVLRSDGDLYQIMNFNTDEQEVEKYETHLSTSNDAEGLCLDASKQNLLVACKGKAHDDPKWDNYKAVYSFNLSTKELSPNPLFAISLDSLSKHLAKDKNKELLNRVAKFFNPASGDLTFQPSGIDVHPITKEIYLIATAGKLLVIMDASGKQIVHIEPLDPDVFKQPESICFMANGDLYIGNEARGGKANILKFGMAK